MYNTGQTAVFLKDLTGKEYPAIAEVNRKKRVNGQREITLSFLYTEINQDFMNALEFGWEVLFDGEWYTITHPGYSTDGDYLIIDVSAVLSFFVVMNGYYMQDKAEDKSSTAANYFNDLFQGTPYNYIMVDHLPANTLSYQDNQSKTERFLYGIDRYKAEYKVQGKLAYIYELAGSDKDVILHEDLNVNSVRIDVDGSGFHTFAKGYGDLPDGDTDGNYRLEVEYISPLAEKYGMIEGPAIKDGKYKDADALREAVKEQVENSYIVSTQIDAVDLTNNGYPEMILEEGDRIWLVVDKLKLNQKGRVVEINETFDWEGNVINATYTAGNQGIAERYKTQQYSTVRDFRDIMSGRKRIEYNWLPDAIQRASDIINGNLDSHFQYGIGEIIGINKSNPNGYMRFNTDGLGFSRDGGKTYRTAMTYEGIVADAITAGTLRGIVIEGVDIFGGIIHSLNNDNTFWDLETGEMNMENADITLGNGAKIKFEDPNNSILFSLYDTDENFSRVSGIGVGTALGGKFPFAHMGTYGGPEMDTLGPYYSGFVANTTARIAYEDAANGVYGQRFRMINNTNYDKGIYVDFFKNEMYPINTGTHNYDLGIELNRWNQLWVNRLRVPNDFLIQNIWNPDIGWRMETQYSGDGHGISLYPIYTGSYNYVIGKTTNKLTNVFSDWFTGSVDSSSSVNSKMNIEELDPKIAFDYVNMMNLYTYYYQDTDYTNPFEKRVSPIIEQLDPANEHLFKASESTLDINSNLFLVAAAFKYKNGITDNEISLIKEKNTVTDNEIILIKERLEMLENGTETA